MKSILKCIGWSILYFVITFVVQFGFMMVGIANGIENEQMLNQFAINNNLLVTIFSNIITIIIFGIVYNVKKKKGNQVNHINNTKKSYVILTLIAFLYSMLFLIITYKASFMVTNDMMISMNYFNNKNQFLGFVLYASSILLIAPITEELLCRGIMINELNKKFAKNKSIIISAVVFGFMHLLAGGVILFIGATIMGIILGIVYNVTKSLRSTILVHSVANFSDILFLFICKMNSNNLLAITILITISLVGMILLYIRTERLKLNKI